jgi:dienelactone hydrolase
MRAILAVAILTAIAGQTPAAVKNRPVDYTHEGVTMKGQLYWDDATDAKRPGILVVHEWWGLNDYARKRATMLAEMGYAALAVDMYGDGKTAAHPKEAGEMMEKVRSNQKLWDGRAAAGLAELRKQPMVDPNKIAVIGYCFGGSTALNMAIGGADIRAAVSFHGALPDVTAEQAKKSRCKILVCHGADDSFIPEKVCAAFRAALGAAGADYEFAYFGGAKHSFTVADADARGIDGIKYNAAADRRSWEMMCNLFREAFEK